MPLGRGDSRDALQIEREFYMLKSGGGEEGFDCRGLTVSDFECDETAGSECSKRGGDETAVDVESILPGKESECGLVVSDFDGQ